MSNHSADAGKMACRHAPRDRVAAFVHVCKRCGVPIEAIDCVACNGMGLSESELRVCRICKGTGIDLWEEAT